MLSHAIMHHPLSSPPHPLHPRSDDASLSVRITSPDSDLYIEISMEPHQRKTVFFRQHVWYRALDSGFPLALYGSGYGSKWKKLKHEPQASDLFYDGKNSGNEALLRFRVSQFGNVCYRERLGSWLDVMAEIGACVSGISGCRFGTATQEDGSYA